MEASRSALRSPGDCAGKPSGWSSELPRVAFLQGSLPGCSPGWSVSLGWAGHPLLASFLVREGRLRVCGLGIPSHYRFYEYRCRDF